MLHPGVCRHDKVARQQRAARNAKSGNPVQRPADALLAAKKQAEKAGLEKECVHALEGERLPEHAAAEARKAAPVGPESELERNSRNDPKGKIDGENLRPELRSVRVAVVPGHQVQG